MYLNYINNFRGIAILFIVAGHCISAFEWKRSEEIYKLLEIFFSNGTVLFVFIAGYLFQHLSHRFHFKKYFYNKLLYVAMPYIICSIPAVIFYTFFSQRVGVPDDFYNYPIYIQIVKFYLTGAHLAPYWFIPMIFIYYSISFILVFFDRKKVLYYFLPVYIALSLAVPRGAVPESFLHFFSVYVFGMFCSRYKEFFNSLLIKNRVMLINLIMAIVFVYLQYANIYNSNYLQKMFLSLLFLGFLNKYDKTFGRRLSLLASTSFGIYFTHSYLISGVKMISFNTTGSYFNGNLANYFMFSFTILFISTILIFASQKTIRDKSRYIVGS